jgi:hypothetical protein
MESYELLCREEEGKKNELTKEQTNEREKEEKKGHV